MRQAGILADERQARQFADYLHTLGIETRVDRESQGYAVWVRDDDRLAQAKSELEAYQRNPGDARYQGVEQSARKLRAQQSRKNAQIRKNLIDARKLWEVKASACPLTKLLIAMCLLVYALQHWPEKSEAVENLLSIAPLEDDGTFDRQRGLANIREGQVWRLVTPMLMHAPLTRSFGILHLLFNMFWLQDLGTQIEWRRGTWRLLLLVLVVSTLSNLAQYLASGPLFYGMSGVVFGLFGYVWMKGKYDPQSHLGLYPQSITVMLVWFVLCWTIFFFEVANTAHTVGLAVGMFLALAPLPFRKLRRRDGTKLRS